MGLHIFVTCTLNFCNSLIAALPGTSFQKNCQGSKMQ